MSEIMTPPGVEAIQAQMKAQNDRMATAYQQKEEAEAVIKESKSVIAGCQFALQQVVQEHQQREEARQKEEAVAKQEAEAGEDCEKPKLTGVPPIVKKAAADAAGSKR